jgi:putative transposase
MPSLPDRHKIRLPAESYRRPGSFFVTVCVADRRPILGACDHGIISLSPLGELCRSQLLALPGHWPGVVVDAWVVMPDHVHVILHLRTYLPQGLPQVIAGFKAGISRDAARRSLAITTPLWQRGFHDRALTSTNALVTARRYIASNPARWA